MIAEKFVDRFARNSGIDDKFIAEREVALTYALDALLTDGVLKRLAFKGGTALRKLLFGRAGRFSLDLDFTLDTEDSERDEVLEKVLDVFSRSHHGIYFEPGEFYFTDSDSSFGGEIFYKHEWNEKGSFKLQISSRERPTLPISNIELLEQEYFGELEFSPKPIRSLAPIEMIAEKVRATFQRSKVRDLYDLHRFANSPFDGELLRELVVLKLWQSKDPFDPEKLFSKIRGTDYDWDDLKRLVRPNDRPKAEEMLSFVEKRYAALRNLSELEQQVIQDSKSGRNEPLAQKLRDSIFQKFSTSRAI